MFQCKENVHIVLYKISVITMPVQLPFGRLYLTLKVQGTVSRTYTYIFICIGRYVFVRALRIFLTLFHWKFTTLGDHCIRGLPHKFVRLKLNGLSFNSSHRFRVSKIQPQVRSISVSDLQFCYAIATCLFRNFPRMHTADEHA